MGGADHTFSSGPARVVGLARFKVEMVGRVMKEERARSMFCVLLRVSISPTIRIQILEWIMKTIEFQWCSCGPSRPCFFTVFGPDVNAQH